MSGDSGTRKRMLAATARLVQRQGMAATGLNEILEASQAPRGSLYHHFPRGKNQLVAEAIGLSAARVTAAIETAMAGSPTVAEAIQAFAGFYEQSLSASDYRDGCPVAATALEAAALGAAEVEAACAEAFAAWQEPIARRLAAEGYLPDEAAGLATFIIASLEGALLLAQGARSTGPLKTVAARIAALFASPIA